MKLSFATSLTLHMGLLLLFCVFFHSTQQSTIIGETTHIQLYLPHEAHFISVKTHETHQMDTHTESTSRTPIHSLQGFSSMPTHPSAAKNTPTTLATQGKMNPLLIEIHNQVQERNDAESDNLPTFLAGRTVTLQFSLQADGSFSAVSIIRSSGVSALDQMAISAVQTVHLNTISFKIAEPMTLQITVKFL